ncbi:MAG: aldo/keto reductase [Ruminococcus sp.]|nr:aldo/keto reductase [Ruminococcus sp.]
MEYRQLPHGNEHEKFSVLGLGMGGIQKTPQDEIEAIIRKAIDHGINFFDLCAGGAVYEPFGRAIKGQREKVFVQCHFGAVYDEMENMAGVVILKPLRKRSFGNWKHWERIMWIWDFCTV